MRRTLYCGVMPWGYQSTGEHPELRATTRMWRVAAVHHLKVDWKVLLEVHIGEYACICI